MGGGSGDIANNYLAWASEPSGSGSRVNHYSIWSIRLPRGHPRLLKEISKGTLASDINISYPYVSWIEYRELRGIRGPWEIHLFNLKDRSDAVVASWKDTGIPAASQDVPFTSLDGRTLVWNSYEEGPTGRRFCVIRLDIVSGASSDIVCTPSAKIFPHFPRVKAGVISYIVNTRAPDQPEGGISEPRSPNYPGLARLFQSGGPLFEWNLMTRAVEADRMGVAWIAETPGIQGGGRIFYWEPGQQPTSVSTQYPDFPANHVALVRDAIVWGEPEAANNVFAIHRASLGCGTPIRLLPYSMTTGPASVQLLGASPSRVLIGVTRLHAHAPPLASQSMEIVQLPKLTYGC